MEKVGTPDEGHRFEITVRTQGSYGVVGEPHHRDSDVVDEQPIRLTVRAWDLPAALRKAAEAPLSTWLGWHDNKED